MGARLVEIEGKSIKLEIWYFLAVYFDYRSLKGYSWTGKLFVYYSILLSRS